MSEPEDQSVPSKVSEPITHACIDELLGPKARAKGCRCPCPAHTLPQPVEEKANAALSALEDQESEVPNPSKPHDGKMEAANDHEEPDDTA